MLERFPVLHDGIFRYVKLDFLHGCCVLETMHKLVHMVNFKNIHHLCVRTILFFVTKIFGYEKLDFLRGCCGLETMHKLVHMLDFKNMHHICVRTILHDGVFRYKKPDFLHGFVF